MALIKRKWGFCAWRKDERGKIKDFRLTHDKYDRQGRSDIGGAYNDQWLEHPDKEPAYLYGMLKAWGFASVEEEIRTLKEIGKMKHCKWARQIARALEENGYADASA